MSNLISLPTLFWTANTRAAFKQNKHDLEWCRSYNKTHSNNFKDYKEPQVMLFYPLYPHPCSLYYWCYSVHNFSWFPLYAERMQGRLHLCLYLLVQALYDNMDRHTGAVFFLLLTQLMPWWDRVITIWMTTHRIQQDLAHYTRSNLGRKHLYLDPKHRVDHQDQDPFECTYHKNNGFPLSPHNSRWTGVILI